MGPRSAWSIRPARLLLVLAMGALALTSCIEGPIAGTPSLAGIIPLASVGYQQQEFFLSAEDATAYQATAPLTADGRWSAAPAPGTGGTTFVTRIVVHRPVDPARFDGTVVVEWMNVTAGLDLGNDWIYAHNEIVRSGAAWVGVSAQVVGVNAVKAADATRYAKLVHPGDSYSYDIFTRAGRAVRDNPTVLGGLVPERLIATGESQSASRLVTYIDAVHPLVHVYDGFLVHSRGSSGALLSQSPLPSVSTPSPSLIRDDLDEPVFVVQAEGDVISSNLAVGQPDTARFREWELAGTAHADTYMAGVGFTDVGDGAGAVQMFSLMRNPNPPPSDCASSPNAGGHHWTFQAALHGLDEWIRTGTPPASGPPLLVASTSPVVLQRDAVGNALGGVRSPHVDAPVATLTGINSGSGFCRLFGSTVPLTAQQLAERYPTHEAFVDAWRTATEAAVAGGFLLQPDADELLAAAQASTVPS
ncbi:MAG: alpha/beta hydrolase domain-containing protein [Acidimicrobiales bacterium]